MAEFLTAVVAHATDFDRSDDVPGPVCFKCRKRDQHVVETGITEDDVVHLALPRLRLRGAHLELAGYVPGLEPKYAVELKRGPLRHPMAKPLNEDLETFLHRQDAGDLVAVLLELAKDHEAVQARLAHAAG